jgi:hypothetical protein
MNTIGIYISTALKKYFKTDSVVVLSGRISLEENTQELIDIFEKIMTNDLDVGKGIEINLCNVDFIYPSALMFIIAIGRTLGESASVSITCRNKSTIHEYLIYCGFNKFYAMPPLPNGFRPLLKEGEVLKFDNGGVISNSQQKAEWFVDQVSTLFKIQTQIETTTIDSIEEILRNVKQHSSCQNWYGLGQAYPTSGSVRFVVYDDGKGIKSHIISGKYSKKHKVFQSMISSDEYRLMRKNKANYAIEKAAIKCVSGTQYLDNSGAGLNFLVEDFSKLVDGSVSVLSEDGFIMWKNGNIALNRELPFKVKGTMVSLTAKGQIK